MANEKHTALLRSGVKGWNAWRDSTEERPDLRNANLAGAGLQGANLRSADLCDANLRAASLYRADVTGAAMLSRADLTGADLTGADLTGALLIGANLTGAYLTNASLQFATLLAANLTSAHLTGANLTNANLRCSDVTEVIGEVVDTRIVRRTDLTAADLTHANLTGADLTGANLTNADLTRAVLVETNLEHSILQQCRVYGASIWNVRLAGASQSRLRITSDAEAEVTVDDLEVAQFIYLLLNNTKLRDVIDTVTSKAVLLLGRFTPLRKAVLDAMHAELRRRGYLPILFDFTRPTSRSLTETVLTLAGMARFVIADLTDFASVPQELTAIALSALTSVPVQPVLLRGSAVWSMFLDLQLKGRFLTPYEYDAADQLVASLWEHVISPAEKEADARSAQMARLYAEAEARRRLPARY